MATFTDVDTGLTQAPTQTAFAPQDPSTPPTVLSLREAAIVVLLEAGVPLRAAQIVDRIRARRMELSSTSRTPTQSINRDLHSAVRRGDTRVVPGPLPGQFLAAAAREASPDLARTPTPSTARARASTISCRLPIEPLADVLVRAGGFTLCAARSAQEPLVSQRLAKTLRRSMARGWISLHDADAICVQYLGLHPCLVWGSGWWDTLEEIDRQERPEG